LDPEEKVKKGPKKNIINAIFKKKNSRDDLHPTEDKDGKKKSTAKESPKKKIVKRVHRSSGSSGSSDYRPNSPHRLPSPPQPALERPNSRSSDRSPKCPARPESSTSGGSSSFGITRSRTSSRSSIDHHRRSISPSPSPSPDAIRRRTSSSVSPHAKKRTFSRSPYNSQSSSSVSPTLKPESKPILTPMLSPMSESETGHEKSRYRSRKDLDKMSKRQKKTENGFNKKKTEDPAVPLKPVSPVTRIKKEIKEEPNVKSNLQQTEIKTSQQDNTIGLESTKIRKDSSLSQSDEDESDNPSGNVAPYCQKHHMPHPSIEELKDKAYLARLQVISKTLSNPRTAASLLNSVVDLILETGNFATDKENFNFDICNLDQGTIGKIEEVLELH